MSSGSTKCGFAALMVKQAGVKELTKMMGLPNWLHWIGWFSITILISIITISVMTMVIVLGNIFENVDPLIIFMSLFLYGFSTICFNFAQSTIFSNRKSTHWGRVEIS